MKKQLLIFLFAAAYLTSLSQNEGNNWYFGGNAGITFNTSPPTVLNDGEMFTFEGCATISDQDGVLLFYTDGLTVWNSEHDVMPNGGGLSGDSSSSQSGIIVKKPGDNPIYFVFTVAAEGFSNGLRYSEVDMSLEGGLGNINANKNIPIVSPTCEKVMAVTHSNGDDFWIVTHLYGSNEFHSYLLTENGLDTTPVVSSVGVSVASNSTHTIGYLKSSLDGSLVACAHWTLDVVDLFQFNGSTGELTNPISINNSLSPYGVEFSPDGSKLYVAEVSITFSESNIYQYDVTNYDDEQIEDSRLTIHSGAASGYGALQVGPDLKIYTAYNSGFLGVINEPNLVGADTDYDHEGIALQPGSSTFGLPAFYNAAIAQSFLSYDNTCIGDSTEFSLSNDPESASWNFDDPASGINNTSELLSPIHVFSGSGDYDVSVIVVNEGEIDTINTQITIHDLPTIDLQDEFSACEGESITIDAGNFSTYLWNNDSNNSSIEITEPGTYSVVVSENGCFNSDSTIVSFSQYPIVDLGLDTLICEGVPLVLDAFNSGASYTWSDNSDQSSLTVSTAGIYDVIVDLNSCVTTDEIEVFTEVCISILEMPNVFSPNGDDYNTRFVPALAVNIGSPQIKIFNRWGGIVYESNRLLPGWDGKSNSNDVSDGVYYWIITYTDTIEGPKEKSGTVTVLR